MLRQPYQQPVDKVGCILEAWKMAEILTVSNSELFLNYMEKREELLKGQSVSLKVGPNEEIYAFQNLPHLQPGYQQAEPRENCEATVYWQLYLGHFNWTRCELALKEKVDSLFEIKSKDIEQPHRKKHQIAPLAGIILDGEGAVVFNSMLISYAVWAFGKIMAAESPEQLNALIAFKSEIEKICQRISCQFTQKFGTNSRLDRGQMAFIRDRLIDELACHRNFLWLNQKFYSKRLYIGGTPLKRQKSSRNWHKLRLMH